MPIVVGGTAHSCSGRRAMDSSEEATVSSRKIRKPLMERKRRARINRSLDELHRLLTENEFASKGCKLEKADILEMTVRYLRQVKRRDGGQEMEENLDNALRERYLLGFEKCAEEMEQVLADSPDLDPRLGRRLRGHLGAALQRARDGPRRATAVLGRAGDLRVLPSDLPDGDVLLLLSSGGGGKCGGGLSKSVMWRPWR